MKWPEGFKPLRKIDKLIQDKLKLFSDENGPFQASDEMMGMTLAMGDAMNEVVIKRNKQMQRASQGATILAQYGLN